MAKDRKKLIHIHSSIPDKQPTPQSLAVGEIAVNNAADQEFLSIKNSKDKVKRFSSDEQMITWMEKKEVMPYVGYVRGGAGPSATSAATPTKDAYGSYGILDSDLSGNTSEIVIKLNQVAASATTKHERVNGSKDRYNKDVNPTTDSGVNDGAGFFIDMSRYAMQGANPEFSGITNTCYTSLNGTTKIKGVNGACGSLLEITVNSAKTDIETANTEITSATTVIGTNTTTISGNTTLNVSGTTTETKNGNVTENNLANKTENTTGNVVVNTTGTTTETKVGNVTENHSGTTTDNNKGNVVVNNQANFNMNTSGNTTFTTTGDTVIHSDGAVGITAVEDIVATSSESSIIVTANDDLCETAGDVAAFKGVNKTNIGIDCLDAGRTKVTNVYGDTINERANTADTRVTSAYTSATTATTIIGTANTSATTATLSGNTLVVNEATSISAKTPTAYVSGTTLNIKETNTDITSCGRISANTNDFEVKQCAANGKVIINSDDIDISGKTFDVVETTSATIKAPATTISGTSLTIDEGTSISAKTPSTTISGTNFTLNESNTVISSCTKIDLVTDDLNIKQCSEDGGTADFEFCNGFNVNSNAVKFEQCSTAGTFTIKEKTTNISGETLTIRESGATSFSGGSLTTTTSGNTNINSSGTTTLTSSGNTTIEATGLTSDVCISATDSARVYGKGSTYVGVKCDGTIGSATTIEGTTLVLSGNTTNISGATTLNLSGKTVNVDATDIDVDASNNYCLSAATKANIYGKTTNIGVECGGTTATTINVSGTTINEGGTTLNESFQDYDINASKTYCVSAATNANFYGKTTNIGVDCGGTTATTINVSGTTINEGGTTNNNSFTTINNTATTINNKTTNFNITGTTYISGDTTISGTTTIGNTLIIKEGLEKKLSWSYGDVKGKSSGSTNFKEDKSFVIPQSVGDLSGGTLTLKHNGETKTYDATADVSFTAPHSALTATYEATSGKSGSVTYDTSAGKSISIPTSTAHLTRSALTINYGNIYTGTTATSYDTTAAKTITIPDSLSGVSNGHIVDSAPTVGSGTITIDRDVNVSGKVTATGAIYSSDRNLKENIFNINDKELDKAAQVSFKTYNFKGESNKMYGVIAQDLQEIGLNEMVYTKEDGTLAVDYTSLMILEIAKLRNDNNSLLEHIAWLERRIEALEGEKKD